MTRAEALRTTIAFLTAQLAIEEGKPAGTYLGQILPGFNAEEAEKKRLAEIAESMKPHAWVDLAPGTAGQAGDNDKPDDDLLRAFGPFMDAARDAHMPDSHGALFTLQSIKKRAGTGWKSWGVVRDEIRILWFSEWGLKWRNHSANAFKVPKPEVVDQLFSKVYE